MITISGTTFSRGLTTVPLSGVAVAIVTSTGSTLGTSTTDASGKFSIPIATGGTPVDGFIRATTSGYVETDFYPSVPWTADQTVTEIDCITPTIRTYIAEEVSTTLDPDAGQAFVQLVDCQGKAISGATASATPAGQTFYVANGSPTTTATMTDVSGSAFLLNLPLGAITLAGRTGSTMLRGRSIKTVTTAVIQAEVQP
jgi:hypothetical protein